MTKYPASVRLLLILLFLSSCSGAQDCDVGYENYEVYLYRTPEQNFLFFKSDTRRPIDFSAEENPIFSAEIDNVFSAYFGRSIGVEALVCGRVARVDLPLSTYDKSLMIRNATIVRRLDLTKIIDNYQRSLGYPAPDVHP